MTIGMGAALTEPASFSDYIVALAREIVQNVEADTWSLEEALTRTRRLAGACGHSDYERWLGYELAGYPAAVDPEVAALLKRANLPDATERRTYFNSSLVALSAGLGKLAQAAAFNRKQMILRSLPDGGDDLRALVRRPAVPRVVPKAADAGGRWRLRIGA